MIARLTSGGGAGTVINDASGSDGPMSVLTNPIVLGVVALAAYMGLR